MTSVLRRSGSLSAVERPTVGDLKMSMVGVDHVGWLRCDGRPLLIEAYRSLYEVIGNSFGDASAGYFLLPNPEGRVLGMVGQADASSNTWIMGDLSGSETHTLTVGELPAHNHDISGGPLDVSNGVVRTANGFTDASGAHTHTATDSGHTHGGVPNQASTATNGLSNNTGNGGTTDTGYANITVSSAGSHRHQIASNGADQAHNNIQPTIWIGNLFVYGGRLFRDTPEGGNWFPPSGPLNNIY